MKSLLTKMYEHHTLDKAQAKQTLIDITTGKFNNMQLASFMSVYLMRAITVDELSGFTEAMLELAVKPDFSDHNFIDIVGTGGDGKDTFNISTLSCFVVAGARVKVVKHGNYGVSSISGSSNVMEYLGYQFTNNEDKLKQQVEKANVCFLHAPLFHPAMKSVAPVRKELGVRTFFNLLGPLVNPSLPKNQLLGVYNLELARLYNYHLQQEENKKYMIVHSLDGYDEISLTSPFKVYTNTTEKIVTPAQLQFKIIPQSALYGGESVKEAAAVFISVLKGEGTLAQENAVVANAAHAISCVTNKDILTSIEIARESIRSGSAFKSFSTLINLN